MVSHTLIHNSSSASLCITLQTLIHDSPHIDPWFYINWFILLTHIDSYISIHWFIRLHTLIHTSHTHWFILITHIDSYFSNTLIHIFFFLIASSAVNMYFRLSLSLQYSTKPISTSHKFINSLDPFSKCQQHKHLWCKNKLTQQHRSYHIQKTS